MKYGISPGTVLVTFSSIHFISKGYLELFYYFHTLRTIYFCLLDCMMRNEYFILITSSWQNYVYLNGDKIVIKEIKTWKS